jgi:hypothetical protein
LIGGERARPCSYPSSNGGEKAMMGSDSTDHHRCLAFKSRANANPDRSEMIDQSGKRKTHRVNTAYLKGAVILLSVMSSIVHLR